LKGDPLKPILMEAFQVASDRIVGPSWLDEDCFEIFPRMPEGATRDQVPAMLQALLAERFKLAAHKKERPRSVYALVVDKDGPKFKQSGASPNFLGAHAGQTRFRAGPQEDTTSTSRGRPIGPSNLWEASPRRPKPLTRMPPFRPLPQPTSLPPSASRWD
jgi:uncharacterized protein (TIGR03435 family)